MKCLEKDYGNAIEESEQIMHSISGKKMTTFYLRNIILCMNIILCTTTWSLVTGCLIMKQVKLNGSEGDTGSYYSDNSIKNTVLRPNRQYKASTAKMA